MKHDSAKPQTTRDAQGFVFDEAGNCAGRVPHAGASETPEMDRLIDRFFGDPDKKLVNFNAWWGPNAASMTAEQRAAAINKALDAMERGDCEVVKDFDDERREPREVRDILKDYMP